LTTPAKCRVTDLCAENVPGHHSYVSGWARKDTALADPESIDHATVDVTGLDPDFRQMLQAAGHAEISGVVDDGFRSGTPART